MADTARIIRSLGRVNPINVLADAEMLQSNRQRNALDRERIGQENELRRAMQGGDVNDIARFDPGVAGQIFDLEQAQQAQAAKRMMVFADRVVSSANPKAMFDVLRNSPEFLKSSEQLGMDFSAIGDLADADPEVLRNEASSIRDALSTFITGSPLGLVGNPDIPSRVRNAIFFGGLPHAPVEGEEPLSEGTLTRGEFVEANRSLPIIDAGGVPTQVQPGGATLALSTPEEEVAAVEAEAAAEVSGKSGGLNLTPGQLAVDKAFSIDFVAWQAGGGFADVEKNVTQLANVQAQLENLPEGVNLTGGMVGITPRAVLARTNPGALDALEQVEEVVQRNLRLILGAQFTEKEGERLIARAYNPNLDEKLNAKRLGRLQKSLVDAAKAKQASADYFNEHGTLAGFTGTAPSISSIMNSLENSESPEERVKRLRVEVAELEAGQDGNQ